MQRFSSTQQHEKALQLHTLQLFSCGYTAMSMALALLDSTLRPPRSLSLPLLMMAILHSQNSSYKTSLNGSKNIVKSSKLDLSLHRLSSSPRSLLDIPLVCVVNSSKQKQRSLLKKAGAFGIECLNPFHDIIVGFGKMPL